VADFDVIVVGAGAGGGVAAWSFAMRGKRVLLIERGHSYPPGWQGRDLLRNHRFSVYGHSTGPDPDGNPRTVVSPSGSKRIVKPFEGGYQNNAMAVGGGTRVYGAQAWRFHPLDFEMASTYGVPSDSSLMDWPISYSDLEPYYERIEHELGVCGGPAAPNLPERRPYPMKPLPPTEVRSEMLQNSATGLGWSHQSVPLLLNSEPRAGRAACIRCEFCAGFGCPTDAKAGTQNTVIPQLLQHAGCELWTETRVTQLLTDSQDKVVGVEIFRNGNLEWVRSDVVVLAAGAIESARLLLLTKTPSEPEGVGNNCGLVGRNLQGHYYPGAQALFDHEIQTALGPGPSIAVTQFNHGNPGIVGGGMLADDFVMLPVGFARDRKKPGVPRYGQEFKDWVRFGYRRSCHIFGPVQEIPSPNCRVTLDPNLRDDLEVPVAQLSGTTHPETIKTALFMRDRAADWLRATGAKEVWTFPVSLALSAGQHQAGTCRMGVSSETGVVSSAGVVFGHENLLICDGSVHVTNGGFNPVLTIMAAGLRSAELFN
jgi:choline dehydrogenase-like flavoprotein